MIRFIDLTGQIDEDQKEFAFFNTITGRFINGKNGDQTWDSIDEFIEDCESPTMERCRSLIPENFFKTT